MYILQSPETLRLCRCPETGIRRGFRRIDQRIGFEERIDLVNRTGFHRVQAFMQMVWADLRGILQSHRDHDIAQGGCGLLLKPVHALGLILDDQTALPRHALGRDSGRALAGMALQGLDAAQ